MDNKKYKTISTSRIVFGGFLLAIMLGTLLLMMPISAANGKGTPFIDALFTSTTSVCVTGLVTVPTYLHWSVFGKIIILILIQLGGLGVICITMGFLILIGKRISLSGRKVIQESYNLDTSQGMVKLVMRIIKTTAFIEVLGAIGLSVRFVPKYGLARGTIYSLFHSISAFCNAGLDLLGSDSLIPYRDDVYFNIIVMVIIVSGGLGFIVWWEILDLVKLLIKGKMTIRQLPQRCSLHSKIVLMMTGGLLLSGLIIIFLLEYNNPETIGSLPLGKKILVCMFQSVTLRTAGFCTISQTGFRAGTAIIMCFFMLIGGSPVGTAGGIKTTTVAILLFEVLSVIRGKSRAEVFRRQIDRDNVRTALAVAFISISMAIIALVTLTFTEQASVKAIMYEVFSATGTVGISMDLTARLSTAGKCVIIILMFMGRIGPITMAMAFAERRKKMPRRDLPERRIVIG